MDKPRWKCHSYSGPSSSSRNNLSASNANSSLGANNSVATASETKDENSTISGRGLQLQSNYYEAFETFLRQPLGQSKNQNGDATSKPLTEADLDDLERSSREKDEARIKELETEIARRKANIRRIQEAKKTFKEEQEGEREAMKKEGLKIQRKYQQTKFKIEKLEKYECEKLQKKLNSTHGSHCFFGPLITKLGVDLETMSCAEGKPIDIHNGGKGGTCSVWDCPQLNLANQEKSDDKDNPSQ